MNRSKTPSQPLRVLFLEDSPDDLELIQRELRRAGVDFTARLAEERAEFEKALDEFRPQVILSDFKLPRFDGLSALRIARERAADVPFLFVSGSIGEATAVETLSQGASDYIFKDNLVRLGPAVARVVADAEMQRLKRKAEERLRQSEEYYRTLVETSPDAIIIVDAGGRVSFASARTRELVELPAGAAMEGLPISEFVAPEDWPGVQERLAALLSGHSRPEVREYRLHKHDGRLFWGEIFSSPLRDAQGRIIHLMLICRDVSERKRSEEQIRYQAGLLQDVSDAIIATDARGTIRLWNQAAEKIYGWRAPDVVGRPFHDVIDPEYELQSRDQVFATLRDSGSWTGELTHRLHDGRRIPVLSTITALRDGDGRDAGMVSVNRDITSRKQAEAEILRQKTFLEKLVEAAPEGIAITDHDGRVLQVNGEFERLFGYEAAEAAGRPLQDLVVPPERREEGTAITRCSGEGQIIAMESVRRRRDGSLLDVSIIATPIVIEGRQVAVYAIYRDISRRKRSEVIQAIQYRIAIAMATADDLETLFATVREELRPVVDTTNFLLALYDEAKGRFIAPFVKDEKDAINEWPAAGSLTGRVVDEGRPILLNKAEILRLDEARARQPIGSDPEAWLGVPLIVGGHILGAMVVQSYTDAGAYDRESISILEIVARQLGIFIERKRIEEQIKASLKEKEVLLKEIHHRVKNNLQIVSGLLTMQADQAGDRPLTEIFQESQDRIRSIALIHEKLYGSQDLSEIAFDDYLRALVDSLLLSHGIAAGGVRAAYDLEPVRFTLEKAIPLGLIVNELATNAIKHAFPNRNGGELRIGMRVRPGPRPGAAAIELSVRDDGVGLPKDFETRTQRSLGMNLVRMLARQLQAELQVQPGPGCEFRIVIAAEAKNK